VLLVVYRWEDNASRNSLEKMIRESPEDRYGDLHHRLLSQENKKEAKRARKVLEQIANASGGLAYFPENVDDVHSICEHVAHDIRNQYILGLLSQQTPARRHLPRHSGGSDSPRGAASSSLAPAMATTPRRRRLRRRQLTIDEDSHPEASPPWRTSRRIFPRRGKRRHPKQSAVERFYDSPATLFLLSAALLARTKADPHSARTSNPLVHGPGLCGLRDNVRNVEKQEEQRNDCCQKNCRESRFFSQYNRCASGKQRPAAHVRPKWVLHAPGRADSRRVPDRR